MWSHTTLNYHHDEVAQRLRDNDPFLEVLQFYPNQLADATVNEIASLLRTNTSVKEIDLMQQAMVTSAGVRAIFSALCHNASVEVIYCSGIRLESDCVKELCKMLRMNVCLQTILMSNCLLSGKDTEAVITALASNHGLRFLGLDGNKLNDDGYQAVIQLFKGHEDLLLDTVILGRLSDVLVEPLSQIVSGSYYQARSDYTRTYIERSPEYLEMPVKGAGKLW
eukprot:m.15462 g.15462  ORF g.15462 m.15462 type:complete len:223 (-) comp5022_c0_seq1:73-741(-)